MSRDNVHRIQVVDLEVRAMQDEDAGPKYRLAFACHRGSPGQLRGRRTALAALLPTLIAAIAVSTGPAQALPCPDGSQTCGPTATQGPMPTQGNQAPTTAPQAPNTTIPGYTPPEMPAPTQGGVDTPTLQGTVMPMPTVTAPPDGCILNCDAGKPAPTVTQAPAPTVTQAPPTGQQSPDSGRVVRRNECKAWASEMGLAYTDTGSGACYLVEKTSKYRTDKNLPMTAPPGKQFDYAEYEEKVASCLAYTFGAEVEMYGAINMRTGQKVQLTCDGVRHMMIRADGNNMHDVLDPSFLTCLDKVVSYGFQRPAPDGSGNMNFIAQWAGTANRATVAYNPKTGDIVSVHTNSGSKADDFAGCATFVN